MISQCVTRAVESRPEEVQAVRPRGFDLPFGDYHRARRIVFEACVCSLSAGEGLSS